MDTTDCLGLPYPQCDPPLTKDASDIAQFQALAEATDAAVQALADSIDATLTNPPSVNMSGGVTVAGLDVVHFTSVTEFDNAGMADTTADVVRIQLDGWYLVGGWVLADPGIAFRVEPLVNGDPVSSRQGPGLTAGGTGTDKVAWTDCLFLRAGDALQVMTHHTSSPVGMVTYAVHIWATLVLANV